MAEKPIRRVIRAKGTAEWQEITPHDIAHIERTFKGESDDQLHARMARHFNIVGEFEIEVQESKYGIWTRLRGVEGTTAILPVDAYEDMT